MSRPLPTQFVEQGLCVFQIGGVEAFGEPAIDRREQVAGCGGPALVAAQPAETYYGAQFPELGLLLAGDAQSLVVQFLGGFGMPLPQQQLAFEPVQLCREPARPRPIDDLQASSNWVTASSVRPAISHARARRARK